MNKRVKELRKCLKLSQEEFGARLGVTKNAISNIESGIRGVTQQMRAAIVREFNVNEAWLVSGEGEMFLPQNEDEELVAFFAAVMTDTPEAFRRRLAKALSKLSDEQWKNLADIAETMLPENEHEEDK